MNNYIIQPIFNDHTNEIIQLITYIQQREFNIPVTLNDQPDLLDIEKNYHKTGGNFWGHFTVMNWLEP